MSLRSLWRQIDARLHAHLTSLVVIKAAMKSHGKSRVPYRVRWVSIGKVSPSCPYNEKEKSSYDTPRWSVHATQHYLVTGHYILTTVRTLRGNVAFGIHALGLEETSSKTA